MPSGKLDWASALGCVSVVLKQTSLGSSSWHSWAVQERGHFWALPPWVPGTHPCPNHHCSLLDALILCESCMCSQSHTTCLGSWQNPSSVNEEFNNLCSCQYGAGTSSSFLSNPRQFSFVSTVALVECSWLQVPAVQPTIKVKIEDEESLPVCVLQQGWLLPPIAVRAEWWNEQVPSPERPQPLPVRLARWRCVCPFTGPEVLGLGKLRSRGCVKLGFPLHHWPLACLGDSANSLPQMCFCVLPTAVSVASPACLELLMTRHSLLA